MISLKECEKILNENGVKASQETIKELREVLYALARIELEQLNAT